MINTTDRDIRPALLALESFNNLMTEHGFQIKMKQHGLDIYDKNGNGSFILIRENEDVIEKSIEQTAQLDGVQKNLERIKD